MAALQSCRFISPTPAMSAASAIGRPPSTLSMVTAGRRELCFPGLKLQQHQAAALRPCVAVRAQHRGGGGQPAGKSAEDQHFVEEREHVMNLYADIIDFDQGCLVCMSANEALKMASHVMDSAYLNIGAPNEISTGTIHTTLLAYADIFVDAADDADGRTVSKKTMTSFIGALKGLASISHILLEAALESLSHTHPRESLSEYAFNCDVKAMRHEFKQQMNELEDGIRSASAVEICRMAMPTILEATEITESFVGLMVARRQRALGKAHSKSKVVA